VARVDALQFPVLEFDQEDARQAGEVRAHLASKRTPIGPYDVLIAPTEYHSRPQRRSRSIGATPSWMRRCIGRRRHASMPGWLPLWRHHRRPPSLLSVEVVDSGAASRGESGHPTPAGPGIDAQCGVYRE
jgi:hypothetical protein